MVNSLLELVGLGGLKTAWLGNAATSLGSVSLVESYWHMALFMVIIYSGLITISEDVLDACPKAKGMQMLLRSMSPDVVAVDELGKKEDFKAVESVVHCGCKLFATAHGNSLEDI